MLDRLRPEVCRTAAIVVLCVVVVAFGLRQGFTTSATVESFSVFVAFRLFVAYSVNLLHTDVC